MSASPKVWLITGTSKGFGRVRVQAALPSGDSAVVTARNADTLAWRATWARLAQRAHGNLGVTA